MAVLFPTSFFQLLLGHILFATDNCLVKRKKVKNGVKLIVKPDITSALFQARRG